MSISKQLVASGIALKRKFSNDIFFSTSVKITLALAFFVAVVIASFFILVNHSQRILMTGVIESLVVISNGGIPDSTLITSSTGGVELSTYGAIAIVVIFALLTGIMVSRLALTPIRQAFQMQKRFVSGLAHEIRTPLSVLRMNNEVAKLDVDSTSLYGKIFEENIVDIDRINDMLNNLLLFDRLLSVDDMQFEDVDLYTVARDVAKRLQPLALRKNITISVVEGVMPAVRGNKTALEQVLFNILKNAVMYTPKKGEVVVCYAGKTPTTASITITDTGVGMPQSDLPHIFEPFYRAGGTGKLSGTGIGLAIVCEIMKIHKGTITVESVVGKGTSFTLTLPLHSASALQRPTAPVSKIAFNFSDKTP